MKTKIIYISGNEVFDMHDIRAAFEEVRCALNLDKDTVMFGVPVDMDDACLMKNEDTKIKEPEIAQDLTPVAQTNENIETPEIISETVIEEIVDEEPVATPKKRGRPRKEEIVAKVEEEPIEPVAVDEADEETVETEPEPQEKTIPILSVLSVNEEKSENESVLEQTITDNVDIITEISDETPATEINEPISETEESSEPDLEKLLSEMTPLQEDVTEDIPNDTIIEETESEDISVDATLEQLANEFAETQDKIKADTKSQSRSKIGKLRNILPFKQSKHKDQGIGDLLEWAGIAANDEDFSVPGFFTNVASKK